MVPRFSYKSGMAVCLLLLLCLALFSAPLQSTVLAQSQTQHVVVTGDTLFSLALRYGTTVSAIQSLNNLGSGTYIYVGQVLQLPGSGTTTSGTTSSSGTCSAEHVVRSGDTLLAISVWYDVAADEIAQANQLADQNHLSVGQVLCIPGEGSVPAPPPSSPPSSQQQLGTTTASGTYEVKGGDNLFRIALNHGISLQSLLNANGLTESSLINPGQILIIPGGGAPAPSQTASETRSDQSSTTTTLQPTPTPIPPVATPVPPAATPAAPAPTPVTPAQTTATSLNFAYGIQAHALGRSNAVPVLERVNDLGFTWLKQQVRWEDMEPSRGNRKWGELDELLALAGQKNVNVLFSVVASPAWARENGADLTVAGPPVNNADFANYLGSLAGRYCGGSLKAIEVWNEQNLHYEWGNLSLNAQTYVNMLQTASAAIRSNCSSMLIISGALTPAGDNGTVAIDDFTYMESMLQAGMANHVDGIGAHPSGFNVPPSVTWQDGCKAIQQHGNTFNGACDTPHHSWSFRSTMEGYRALAVQYGAGSKPIVPTEFGWAAGGKFDNNYGYADDNSFQEQAAWTVEAFTMMRNWGWAGPAFLWNLNFRVVANGQETAQWGIVTPTWQPLPTYTALKALAK